MYIYRFISMRMRLLILKSKVPYEAYPCIMHTCICILHEKCLILFLVSVPRFNLVRNMSYMRMHICMDAYIHTYIHTHTQYVMENCSRNALIEVRIQIRICARSHTVTYKDMHMHPRSPKKNPYISAIHIHICISAYLSINIWKRHGGNSMNILHILQPVKNHR